MGDRLTCPTYPVRDWREVRAAASSNGRYGETTGLMFTDADVIEAVRRRY